MSSFDSSVGSIYVAFLFLGSISFLAGSLGSTLGSLKVWGFPLVVRLLCLVAWLSLLGLASTFRGLPEEPVWLPAAFIFSKQANRGKINNQMI